MIVAIVTPFSYTLFAFAYLPADTALKFAEAAWKNLCSDISKLKNNFN